MAHLLSGGRDFSAIRPARSCAANTHLTAQGASRGPLRHFWRVQMNNNSLKHCAPLGGAKHSWRISLSIRAARN